MKRMYILAIAALCFILPSAMPAGAQTLQPRAASEVALADLLYTARAIVVFAPAPEDPYFIRQMQMLAEDTGQLAARDVVLIVDTDPAAKSAVRTMLRPSAFSLVIIDKDGKTALRKPRPWDLREITRAIDKFPSRRDEMLGILPSGR